MLETTLRYIKVDFASHKDALIQRVRSRWPTLWNDFLANSFGIVLVDLIAWTTATLAFLINRAAGELYIPTMTLRESAVRLGALTGYQLRGPSPATVLCEATLTSVQSASVTIAKGTVIRTSDQSAQAYEVVRDYTIEAGNLTPRSLIITLSPLLSGTKVLNSFVVATEGSVNVDVIDTTINLGNYVEAGQTFSKLGSSDFYTVSSLERAPGAVSENTRIVLSEPYQEATDTIEAVVYDRRIQAVQGQTLTDRFVSPSLETPNYSIKFSRTPVIDNSAVVTVNGSIWTQVTAVSVRGAEDEVFQVRTLSSGDTIALFGDGTFGARVPTEAAISLQYRVGGGVGGNIKLSTINTSLTGLITSTSNPVPVSVTNATAEGSGGRDAESLEEARVNIPFYTRTNDRAVTLDDYQTIAQQYSSPLYGSVAFVRSSVSRANSFLEGNTVILYAWTTGASGGLVSLSTALKSALQDYIQTKALGTDLVQVYDGVDRPVPISLRFKTFSGFSVSDTSSLVKDTIKSMVNALRPGSTLVFSDFARNLDSVYGVDNFNIATPIADLVPANDTELFTAVDDDFEYEIQRNSAGSPETDADGNSVSRYTAQLPVFPLAVWSLRLFLGTNELTVVPHVSAGFARVFGTNVTADPDYASTVDLRTGNVVLWLKGAPGDLTMKLVSVQGYAAERPVNLYIGYLGDNSAGKRSEIRAALAAWSSGLAIGGTLYGTPVSGVLASSVSVTDVVSAIDGVDLVTRVALGTPANNESRVVASDFELIRLGTVVVNNRND